MITDKRAESSGLSGSTLITTSAENPKTTGHSNQEPMQFITLPPIMKQDRENSKVRRKSNARAKKLPTRLPTVRSPGKMTRGRRMSLSKSPTKKVRTSWNTMGTQVFMEPPAVNSGTNLSSNSQSTKLTTTTETAVTPCTRTSAGTKKTLTMVSRGTQRTKTSEAMPLHIIPARTRSWGSHLSLGLSKNSVVTSGSAGQSQVSTTTPTGIRIPYFTRTTFDDTTGLRNVKPRAVEGGLHSRTPTKVTTTPLGATEEESKASKSKNKVKKSKPSTATTEQLQKPESKKGKKSKASTATTEQLQKPKTKKGKKSKPSTATTEQLQKPESKKGKKSKPSTATTEQLQKPESKKGKKKSTGQKSKPSTATAQQLQKPEGKKGKKSKPSTAAADEKRNTATSKASKMSNAENGKGKKANKGKRAPSTPSTTATETKSSTASKKSKKSKRSKSSGKGKKTKKGKEKVKKLNRKAIYKDMKIAEKKMEDEAKNRKKMEWEKNKLLFYWNCVVSRLLDLQKRNHGLKKKEASLKMEKKDGMFHHNWKTMNLTRLQREECLDAKRAEFRSFIRELRDSHKRQTDWLFKDIQTYVKDTYLVGQKYVNDVVGIRMDYTKGLTDTLFEARENLRVMEIEQNAKYGPALEEFEEQMRKLRSRIPKERQERLSEMLAKSHGMLVELVNVYTTILHHNYIEVCHTANIINELKSVERRLEREMNEVVKKRDKIKERTEYLHDRVSNLRRQVNAGKEARKKLHRVMKEQEALQSKIDLAYIGKEITYQENSRLKTALNEMGEKVDKWYFKVKRDFMKDIILDTAKHEERASQLKNYNHLVKYLFNEEHDFLETISNFKDHEEFDDPEDGLKVLLGVFRPHTIYDLEREFEGCTESFTTAIIFFKRRLQQNYMSLDDLHFFIKRRSPLSYLNKVRKEEMQLKQLMSFIFGSRYGQIKHSVPQPQGLLVASSNSLKL